MTPLLPKKMNSLNFALLLGASLFTVSAIAAEVPAVLPRPDMTPPSDGKVKVYILAGQSNMVGFGYLDGSRPVYPSIYLSADPGIKVGRMPVGPSALLGHGVYQSAAKNAPAGARVSIYSGAYKAGADYSAMKQVKETTVALGTVSAQLPGIEGPHTVVAQAFIDVPMSGTHELHAGFENSAHAIVTLEGKDVYRQEIGKEAVVTPVPREEGKR